MKLIIVDDDDDDILLAKYALNEFEVIQASDSRSAISAIKNQKADFCLIDFSFSESGRMAHLCAEYSVPAIFWTGHQFPGKHRMFIDKGLLPHRDEFRKRLMELIGDENNER